MSAPELTTEAGKGEVMPDIASGIPCVTVGLSFYARLRGRLWSRNGLFLPGRRWAILAPCPGHVKSIQPNKGDPS